MAGRHDWYRNTSWSPEIEKAFEQKLSRARSQKPQYLKIQASLLTYAEPEVALELLDRYFQLGDTFHLATAHATKAEALLHLGRVDEAIASYEAALDREKAFPSLKTRSALELPYLIATTPMLERFKQATAILEENLEGPAFPIDAFMVNATLAIIASHDPKTADSAKPYATAALEAASSTQSQFPWHRSLGLVGRTHDGTIRLLRGLLA